MIVVTFKNYVCLVYADTRNIYHFIIHKAFFHINMKTSLKLQITKRYTQLYEYFASLITLIIENMQGITGFMDTDIQMFSGS